MKFLRWKSQTDEAMDRLDECLAETRKARDETRQVRVEMEKFSDADEDLRDQLSRLMRGTNA